MGLEVIGLLFGRRSDLSGDLDTYEQRFWDECVGEAMIKFSKEVRWTLKDYVAVAGQVGNHGNTAITKYRGVSDSNLPRFPYGIRI